MSQPADFLEACCDIRAAPDAWASSSYASARDQPPGMTAGGVSELAGGPSSSAAS